jgi:hypothetical protein
MDFSEQEEKVLKDADNRFKEKSGMWNPTTTARQKSYLEWLEKQVNQRQKTLELDGVTHSKVYKEILRRQKKSYEEEYKRIRDLIEDGK